MPIYEYQCDLCGHQLEVLQKINDAPLTECPACHKPNLQKLVSAAGFQLKGTGWYATDFKNKGQTKKPETKQETSSNSAKSEPSTTTTSKSEKGGGE